MKRLLASEPRRLRALATKGAVGAVALSVAVAVAAVGGWIAARSVGSMHGVTVPWNGMTLLAGGATALFAGAVAYSLSAVTRSDSFAKVGTLALILIVDPLLAIVPKVGDYTIGSALDGMAQAMTGDTSDGIAALSGGTALLVGAAWLGLFVTAGAAAFARRDV